MIHFTKGNIFKAPTDCIVVPVNCVGVCGTGIAKQWANHAPEPELRYYYNRCEAGGIYPGDVIHIFDSPTILAATKAHWRDDSQFEWIEKICRNLFDLSFGSLNDKTIAVPKIGCGHGHLAWAHVRDVMGFYFRTAGATFEVYE